MASSLVKSNKMKRMESKKSHSWWWDSHISPTNTKWLQEKLDEMDENVKRMLKLIENDADSFAQRAELYYKKRPELLLLVEEFYRMYRSLAERYDHLTGELRRNIPSDIQSQGSGVSDSSFEPPSTLPSPDQRPSLPKSGPRAAGFDFFLGNGGHVSDVYKEGDESSTLDSESDSDASSINNSLEKSTEEEHELRKRIVELELEIRDLKERFQMQQVENAAGSFRQGKNWNAEDLLARIAGYDGELKVAKEKILTSEEEIAKLKMKLQIYESSATTCDGHSEFGLMQEDIIAREANPEEEGKEASEHQGGINGFKGEVSSSEYRIQTLEEELKKTKEKLQSTEQEVVGLRQEIESDKSTTRGLQDQIGAAEKDVATWKAKLDRKEKDILRLQDRIERYKSNLSERDQEIRLLKETISNANQSLSEENSQLQAGITHLLKERAFLEHNLKEWELRVQSLEEELKRVKAGKAEMEDFLGAEMEKMKEDFVERSDQVKMLQNGLDELQSRYDVIMVERCGIQAELTSKNDQNDKMNMHLHQLHLEHVELIAGAEAARKLVDKLKLRVKELEGEVETQREVILEGAEEKREAIRQLCFSLEHYRNGYHSLLQAFKGHKRLPIMAS